MNSSDNQTSPTLPPLPSKKPPFTSNARSMGVMLIICGIVTAAAFITVCIRHFKFDFSMDWGWIAVINLFYFLSFFVIPIFSPLAILSLSLVLKRNTPITDAMLLIFPAGCAIGCLYMCGAPADNHDGEIMALGYLTILWAVISIPFCCISFFTKEKQRDCQPPQ